MYRLKAASTALALSVALLCTSGALAQSSPQELAAVNTAAMDSYNNLDLDAARQQLESAIQAAEQNGAQGPALARTYINLGVVFVGGFGDQANGITQFVNGLRQDGSVELDPLVSTPDIQKAFDEARLNVLAIGAQPTEATSGPVEGNLDHTPVAEQLSQTGVPVYVEDPGGLEIETIRIFYRSLGMREPASADMDRIADGWGILIPCTDVYEPTVEYFIVALDEDGQQVGNAGTPRAPVVVPIVSDRTSAPPSLPGQPPPVQCGADGPGECPPGMPCAGEGQMGDTCRSDSECGDGLVCSDDFCSVGEKEDKKKSGDGEAPRMFFRLGGAIGAAYVTPGMPAAQAPPSLLFQTEPPINTQDTEAVKARAQGSGWTCDNYDPATMQISDCNVTVDKAGFVSTFAMRLEAGGFVTERLALSGTFRYQFDAGTGTLAGILLGGRLGYLVTEPAETGFHTTLFGGFSVGQIQPKPTPGEDPPTFTLDAAGTAANGGNPTFRAEPPHASSGVGGFNLGTTLGYRFVRNFGLFFAPELDFLVPDFLFNIDLAAGVELAF